MEVPTLTSYENYFQMVRDNRAYKKMISKEPYWPRIENVPLDRAIHLGRRVIHNEYGVCPIRHFTRTGKIYIDVGRRHSELVEEKDLRWFQD